MAVLVVVGLSLSAIQIVPTWELKSLSPRAAGLSYEAITSYSLPPYNLLTFLFPNILGNPVIGYFGEETFEELHAYIGILPLMLVLWAWARKERNRHVLHLRIQSLLLSGVGGGKRFVLGDSGGSHRRGDDAGPAEEIETVLVLLGEGRKKRELFFLLWPPWRCRTHSHAHRAVTALDHPDSRGPRFAMAVSSASFSLPCHWRGLPGRAP
jgi:hypothetical protein